MYSIWLVWPPFDPSSPWPQVKTWLKFWSCCCTEGGSTDGAVLCAAGAGLSSSSAFVVVSALGLLATFGAGQQTKTVRPLVWGTLLLHQRSWVHWASQCTVVLGLLMWLQKCIAVLGVPLLL